VAEKILPLYGPVCEALTVPRDVIDLTDPQTVTVDEGDFTRLLEVWVQFALTKRQLSEANLETAVTLATRSANFLYQGVDLLYFQGNNAVASNQLFTSKRIQIRTAPSDTGLLGAVTQSPVPVPPTGEAGSRYGENSFAAVAQAYSQLVNAGHNGPFALALPTSVYADTYSPLSNTLEAPADRIKAITNHGYYATSALPDPSVAVRTKTNPSKGLLMSLGGSTMDHVVGIHATTAFQQEDPGGLVRLRIVIRFALRVKDNTAIVELDFE